MTLNLSPLPSGRYQPPITAPKPEDKITFPTAKDCGFIDASAPLFRVPTDCLPAMPVNHKRTLECKDHRKYLMGLTKGFVRDGKTIAKGWIALFPLNASADTIAKVVIIPGKTKDFPFESEKALNDFLVDSFKTITTSPAPAPKPASAFIPISIPLSVEQIISGSSQKFY